jgi:hypothetical protein
MNGMTEAQKTRYRLTRLMGACDAGKIEELNQAIKTPLDVH